MMPSGYLSGITGKKIMQSSSENKMPSGAGILFSEVPCRFLCSVSVLPMTLRILSEVFTIYAEI
jgi:hypothetical protein